MHLLGVPDIAALLPDPNPWWVWSSDGARLLLANQSAIMAMGESEFRACWNIALAPSHRFAGQIRSFSALFAQGEESRQVFLTLFDKTPPRTAIVQGQRLRVGEDDVLVLRAPHHANDSPYDATGAFVATAPLKMALFNAHGRLEAASATSPIARGTRFDTLFGPKAESLREQLDKHRTAEFTHTGGRIILAALPHSNKIVLTFADASGPDPAVAGHDDAMTAPERPAATKDTIPPASPAPDISLSPPEKGSADADASMDDLQEVRHDPEDDLVLTIVAASQPDETDSDDLDDQPTDNLADTEVAAPVIASPRPHGRRIAWASDARGLVTNAGAPLQGLRGRRWAEILSPFADESHDIALNALAEQRDVAALPFALEMDGTETWYDLSAFARWDAVGRFLGYQGYLVAAPQDVTRSQPDSPAGAPPADPAPVMSPGLARIVDFPGKNDREPPAPRPQTITPEAIEHNIEKLLERIKTRRGHDTPLRPIDLIASDDKPDESPHSPEALSIKDMMRRLETVSPKETREAPVQPEKSENTPDSASAADGNIANLLAAMPVGVLIQRGHKVLYANETLLAWTGYDSAAALERDGGDARLFSNDGESHSLTHRDGSVRPVSARLSRVVWDGEKAMVYVFSLADEARQAENAAHSSDEAALEDMLGETRARLEQVETVLDTATDGVIVLTNDGAIESLNRSAEALFGYEAAEVKGKSFTILFSPESHRIALDYLDSLSRGGMASLMNDGREVMGKVRQGGVIPLHMSMGRVGSSGAARYAAVLRDLTSWKRTERELREAKQSAEAASVQKSSFLARMSHEMRTPLNAIIGFSELMEQERFGPMGNERYKDYTRDIRTSGEHLLSLLNDLLDLSKVEAGKMELKFEQVNLNDLSQQCMAILQPQAGREHIIIRSSLSPRLPKVVADERSVRQIITNLLSNSIKFTQPGGQVIISTAMTDDGEVALRVRDTGVGMNDRELKMAMEPFRQIATTNPRSVAGTGLGLPLTKALVEANRARFAISSVPQEGTLVEVYFPSMRVLAE